MPKFSKGVGLGASSDLAIRNQARASSGEDLMPGKHWLMLYFKAQVVWEKEHQSEE